MSLLDDEIELARVRLAQIRARGIDDQELGRMLRGLVRASGKKSIACLRAQLMLDELTREGDEETERR